MFITRQWLSAAYTDGTSNTAMISELVTHTALVLAK